MAGAEPFLINRTLLRRLESHPDFPLEALEAVVEMRRRLEDVERDAIATARAKGATWEDIATAIGVTRQAVYQKHRNHHSVDGSAGHDGRPS